MARKSVYNRKFMPSTFHYLVNFMISLKIYFEKDLRQVKYLNCAVLSWASLFETFSNSYVHLDRNKPM